MAHRDAKPLEALDHMPGAEVVCPDGSAGTLEMLGTHPASDELSHLIVRRGFLFQRDLLVPIELVEGIEPDTNTIELNAPLSEVIRLPEYEAPGHRLRSLMELALLPIRLPMAFFQGRWRTRSKESRDRVVRAARLARARALSEHHVFDSRLETPLESLDLNTASAEDLEKIRGIGANLAREIIAHRPYAQLDDLSRVTGLSPQTLHRLRDIVRF